MIKVRFINDKFTLVLPKQAENYIDRIQKALGRIKENTGLTAKDQKIERSQASQQASRQNHMIRKSKRKK